jgi:isoaspartyl peptidase/L-asparaginase-like protein (Ntn-hydrolase superfamily)
MRLAGQNVAEAARAVLADIGALGGSGGLIAVTAKGEIALPFSTSGMKRASLSPEGEITAEVF